MPVKKQNSPEYISRSNWLYSVTWGSGSIPASKHKRALRVFIGRTREGQ